MPLREAKRGSLFFFPSSVRRLLAVFACAREAEIWSLSGHESSAHARFGIERKEVSVVYAKGGGYLCFTIRLVSRPDSLPARASGALFCAARSFGNATSIFRHTVFPKDSALCSERSYVSAGGLLLFLSSSGSKSSKRV